MDIFSKPILRVIYGKNEGERVDIEKSQFLIGRNPSCDWVFASKKISREHLEIYRENGYWWAKDLGSRNHSYLNESRTSFEQPVKLKDGDKIQLGKVTVLQFHDLDATSADTTYQVISKGLTIDIDKVIVYINNKPLRSLTGQSYNLLVLLYKNQGEVVPNKEITQALWGSNAYIADLPTHQNSLDKLVNRLKKELRKYDRSHQYIETIRGKGRRFMQKG